MSLVPWRHKDVQTIVAIVSERERERGIRKEKREYPFKRRLHLMLHICTKALMIESTFAPLFFMYLIV